MKYVKMLGLLVVSAAALMAFAGTASATLTGLPADNTIHAINEGKVSLTGSVTITCEESTAHGDVTENTATTAGGPITSLTFKKCGTSTVTVTAPGSLTAHSTGTNTATVTSKNAIVTVLLHSGILGTVHCTYITPSGGTDIGTLTGTGHSGNTTATLDITASILKDDDTSDFLCGDHATWEGSYVVNTPDHLHID